MSWSLYHFFAPRTWRDWVGAGAVQAFIIALYAEIYGFPLTLYVLTSFLHISVPLVHDSRHLWATVLGYGPAGTLVEIILGYALVIAGLPVIAKGWRMVIHARGRLITDGIYARVRHPQYSVDDFGSLRQCSKRRASVWWRWRHSERYPGRRLDVFAFPSFMPADVWRNDDDTQ